MAYVSILNDSEVESVVISLAEAGFWPIGTVRIWSDADPPVRSSLEAFVFESEPTIYCGQPLKVPDLRNFDMNLGQIIQQANVRLSDYGRSQRRGFHCDMRVTQKFIDGYTS